MSAVQPAWWSAVRRSMAFRANDLRAEWENRGRWMGVDRKYTARDVVELQGSVAPPPLFSGLMADRLFDLLRRHKTNGTAAATFGALSPVQAVQMGLRGAETIYVSGWQASSEHSSSNEPGPDLADYPMDTVPRVVERLTKAQRFHDRRLVHAALQQGGKQPPGDVLRPIIADADTGHGGPTAVMRLARMFAEAGAAGLHLEDQRAGTKKCGHKGGKVLVSAREHAERLRAARLALDVAGAPLVLVARTDAEAAELIDSNADPLDHRFILGLVPGSDTPITLHDALHAALAEGKNGRERSSHWRAEMGRRGGADEPVSFDDARALFVGLSGGRALPSPVAGWSAEPLRDGRGFYRFRAGVDACVARARAFAPVSDLLWMESAGPDAAQARQFSEGVLRKFPGKMLAYNCSPSFYWSGSGMTAEEISGFIPELGRMGFVWQFVTLGGFHASGLAADRLARSMAVPGDMLGYVRSVQEAEREEGVETLLHQTWSGAGYVDALLRTAGGADADIGESMGRGCTEHQFAAPPASSPPK